jgi:hypothetical protein
MTTEPTLDEEPHEWRERRRLALERLEEKLVDDLCNIHMETSDAIRKYEAAKRRLLDPDWLPPRPPRRMPSAQKIAKYWQGRDTFPLASDRPRCWRCGHVVEKWNHLDRAHLVDRFLGGLDHEPNLAMICILCHKLMPMFEPEHGQEAIAWVQHYDIKVDLPSLFLDPDIIR